MWSAPARVLPNGPDFTLNNKTIALADGSYLAPIAIRTGPRRLNPYHEGFTRAGALVTRESVVPRAGPVWHTRWS